MKCADCNTTFRHKESKCVTKLRDVEFSGTYMWEAPCCTRRYSLMEGETDEDICGVFTHGWGERAARDKHDRGHNVFNTEGIEWVWPG